MRVKMEQVGIFCEGAITVFVQKVCQNSSDGDISNPSGGFFGGVCVCLWRVDGEI